MSVIQGEVSPEPHPKPEALEQCIDHKKGKVKFDILNACHFSSFLQKNKRLLAYFFLFFLNLEAFALEMARQG